MQAVIKHAILPVTKALNATLARSALLHGAIDPKAANWTPMDPGLEKPQRA